ncbi:Fumarylacetoacetate hydrolase domain-containing protein 2A [Trichoderma simmonsii]|uniref:Fumarylacetoacetate hydrolase domain-containing protein 2A n=1 Tax=Trichoderma simmonsii TaxID=1491479 RepID=A0A8G0PNC6_9HYPO|nr:Fumarylacetoacetate hydrolase domain-containing protein 2A [Trichoderma simmonsii]
MERNWTHLIRFIAEEDNQVHLGQIDPSIDIGLDIEAGKLVKANLVIGSAFDGKVSNKVLTVKQLLCPIAQHEVPIVRCLGLNYRDHAAEANIPVPNEPILFIKPQTSISSPYPATINVPLIAQDGSSDYEAELAFIISKDGRDIPEEEAQEYVLGYTCSNDQESTVQKQPNVIGDPPILDIQGIHNGTIVQSSNTRELIFGINRTISFLSQGTTLERGTVVMTGTGPGIGGLRSPKIVLQHGDDMRVHIEKIGTLINKVYYE